MAAMSTEQLRARVRGQLIQPEDGGYEEARHVYNAMVDRRPRLIARCVDVEDVMAAIAYGREKSLVTAIRGGGHNGPGFGVVDEGLVIDLSLMRGVRVDPEARTARVGGGAVW